MIITRNILIILIAFIVNQIISKIFNNQRLQGKTYLIFIRMTSSIIIYFIAIFLVLNSIPDFNKAWETVFASSGILAVVLGLAAQSSLSNIFAGISLSSSKKRPFNIGDRVQIGNYPAGYITDITLRHIVIETYQKETIYIPNQVANSEIIINYTMNDSYSYPLEIQVSYDSDIELAINIIENIVNNHPKHFGEDAKALCKQAGDNGVLIKVLITVKNFADSQATSSEVLQDIIKEFRNNNIVIPYPTRTIITK